MDLTAWILLPMKSESHSGRWGWMLAGFLLSIPVLALVVPELPLKLRGLFGAAAHGAVDWRSHTAPPLVSLLIMLALAAALLGAVFQGAAKYLDCIISAIALMIVLLFADDISRTVVAWYNDIRAAVAIQSGTPSRILSSGIALCLLLAMGAILLAVWGALLRAACGYRPMNGTTGS